MGHTADIKNLLADFATFQPTFILSVPRVFEKVYNTAKQKAHGDGKGAIFDRAEKVAIAYSEALDSGGVGPAAAAAARAVRQARLRQAARRHGRQGRVGRLRRRAARRPARPLLPRHRRHDPRGLRPDRDHRRAARSTLPTNIKIGTVGRPLARRDGPHRRRRRDPHVAGEHVYRGYWHNEKATGEVVSRRLVPHRRHRRDRRRRLPQDHRPQEGAHRHRRRQERRPRRARGPPARPPAGQPVHGRRRPEALHRLPGHARPRGRSPAWAAGKGKPEARRPPTSSTTPTCSPRSRRAVDEANKAVSKAEAIRKFAVLPVDWTEEGGQLTPSLKLKRSVVMKEFADAVEALYSGSSAACERRAARLRHALKSSTPAAEGAHVEPVLLASGPGRRLRRGARRRRLRPVGRGRRVGRPRRPQRRRQVHDDARAGGRPAADRRARARSPGIDAGARPARRARRRRLLPRRRRADPARHAVGAPAARRPAARHDAAGRSGPATCSSASTSRPPPTASPPASRTA